MVKSQLLMIYFPSKACTKAVLLKIHYNKIISTTPAKVTHHNGVESMPNTNEEQQKTVTTLQSQIADYGVDTSKDYDKNLYKGINEYSDSRKQKIEEFNKRFQGDNQSNIDQTDPAYFRKRLIDYLISNDILPHFSGDTTERENKPGMAAISMDAFLGEEGEALYKHALEEEMNSKEYRNAVMVKSTTHYEGEKWLERPIVIVAGPSGCGKSYAAQSAVKKASELMPKKLDAPKDGNDVIAVDGGIIREVSQMRKLVIQIANNHGYSGIKDLHKQSAILGSLKPCVQRAALKEDAGLVMPETFSNWINPLASIRGLTERMQETPGSRVIFSRVVNEDDRVFQDVVGFMGARRAWKNKDFAPQELDLNKTQGLSESKAYGESGFSFGLNGSKNAERKFLEKNSDALSLHIVNDLILLKPSTTESTWQPAQREEVGVLLVSQAVYDQWLKNPPKHRGSLPDYVKATRLDAVIKTSSELDYDSAKAQLNALHQLNQNELALRPDQKLNTIQAMLSLFLETATPDDSVTIRTLEPQLITLKKNYETYINTKFFASKEPIRTIDRALNALNKMESEFLLATRKTESTTPFIHQPATSQISSSPNRAFIFSLHEVALSQLSDQATLYFDPQGRILITVVIDEYRQLTQQRDASGAKSSNRVTVSIDAKESTHLYNQYLKQYRLFQLSKEELSQFEAIRGSVIPLQTEFYFHLALACRAYSAISSSRFPEAAMEHAHQKAMADLQPLIVEQFKQALTAARQNGVLNESALISALDKSRKTLTSQAHQFLAQRIVETTGNIPTTEELQQLKHQTERTTATPNDLLHIDHDLAQSTWISSSSVTAHDRGLDQEHLADRQIKSYAHTSSKRDIERLHIRTPSLDFKGKYVQGKEISEADKIRDVHDKIAALSSKYSMAKSLSINQAGYQSFTYNLYTAINDSLDDFQGTNQQSSGAALILKGAHQYNAQQLIDTNTTPVFCFVQNISVNGFGDTLNFKGNELNKEATLMTELALLNNLIVDANIRSRKLKQFQAIIDEYTHYLKKPDNKREAFFSQSPEGQKAYNSIQAIKQTWAKGVIEPLNAKATPRTQIQHALKRMMAHDLHRTHSYAKLIQTLSVLTEYASIGGCKSGNERAQAINGRVSILESLMHDSEHPVMQALVQLNNAKANSNEVTAAALLLNQQLDLTYNKHLQSAASLISVVDQGAAAKVNAKKGVAALFNRNYAEESTLDNLHQSNAGSMQAHKGLSNEMTAAIKPLDYWDYMKSKVGVLGALLSYLIYPISKQVHNSYQSSFTEHFEKAQKVYQQSLKSTTTELVESEGLPLEPAQLVIEPQSTLDESTHDTQLQPTPESQATEVEINFEPLVKLVDLPLEPARSQADPESQATEIEINFEQLVDSEDFSQQPARSQADPEPQATEIEINFEQSEPKQQQATTTTTTTTHATVRLVDEQKHANPSTVLWRRQQVYQTYTELFTNNSSYTEQLSKVKDMADTVAVDANKNQANTVRLDFHSDLDLARYAEQLALKRLPFTITHPVSKKVLAFSDGDGQLFDSDSKPHTTGTLLIEGAHIEQFNEDRARAKAEAIKSTVNDTDEIAESPETKQQVIKKQLLDLKKHEHGSLLTSQQTKAPEATEAIKTQTHSG